MSEDPAVIPEVLHEATKIFLEELRGHGAFFRSIESEPDLAKHANAIAEKFHLIRGGAGFLKLTELKNIASYGEKLFRGGNPDLNTAKEKLAEASRVIDAEIARLSDILSS